MAPGRTGNPGGNWDCSGNHRSRGIIRALGITDGFGLEVTLQTMPRGQQVKEGQRQQWAVNALAQAHPAFVEDGQKKKKGVFKFSHSQTQLCVKPALSLVTARAKEINPSSPLGTLWALPCI